MQISKQELKDLYSQYDNKEICKMLDISHSTLIKYVQLAGIELKGRGNRKGSRKPKIQLI